jgi:hypothetical protein
MKVPPGYRSNNWRTPVGETEKYVSVDSSNPHATRSNGVPRASLTYLSRAATRQLLKKRFNKDVARKIVELMAHVRLKAWNDHCEAAEERKTDEARGNNREMRREYMERHFLRRYLEERYEEAVRKKRRGETLLYHEEY